MPTINGVTYSSTMNKINTLTHVKVLTTSGNEFTGFTEKPVLNETAETVYMEIDCNETLVYDNNGNEFFGSIRIGRFSLPAKVIEIFETIEL